MKSIDESKAVLTDALANILMKLFEANKTLTREFIIKQLKEHYGQFAKLEKLDLIIARRLNSLVNCKILKRSSGSARGSQVYSPGERYLERDISDE